MLKKKKTNKTPIVLTRFLKIINCYSITLTSLISLNGKIRQKGIHEFSIVKGKNFNQASFFFFETQRHFLIYKKNKMPIVFNPFFSLNGKIFLPKRS